MLDELLRRGSLKERIEELEEENHHLQRQLEAEEERRADAVSERQDAEERVNRLQDRVTELEDRVERLQDGDADREFRVEETLRGGRLDEVLDRLAAVETEPEGVLTAYVADGREVPDPVRTALGDRAGLVGRAAPCLVVADDAGLLSACLSVPVAPEPFARWDERVALERAWFRPTGEHAVALVRSDLFALAEFDGDERVAFHGFDSDLKSQHSKGGFSQSRFERLREEQIDSHLERCRAAIEERSADRLYVLGERSVLSEFGDVADVTASVDATGDPEAALEDAVREFWTVRLRVP
ncbi:Vms1/Ankzf1 family peptidyl-tRNA hydrolase [Halomicrobium salinisoli]|uniref:Vms1/Ankzf1 family peptidyl-tRNA hydrolase n=1 Tax=Halomicrobium salinisoli TaxID=2878391 RepID=UPI001CF0C13B|nr:Vms1/Ankzf1 family peptidyl-tRNA hydrolase [Halomicrobium salinisoli]